MSQWNDTSNVAKFSTVHIGISKEKEESVQLLKLTVAKHATCMLHILRKARELFIK